MPKVKPLGSEEMKRVAIASHTNSVEADRAVRAAVKHLCAEMDKSQRGLAQMIGMKHTTLYNRMKTPGSFKLSELRVLDSLSKQYGAGVSFL